MDSTICWRKNGSPRPLGLEHISSNRDQAPPTRCSLLPAGGRPPQHWLLGSISTGRTRESLNENVNAVSPSATPSDAQIREARSASLGPPLSAPRGRGNGTEAAGTSDPVAQAWGSAAALKMNAISEAPGQDPPQYSSSRPYSGHTLLPGHPRASPPADAPPSWLMSAQTRGALVWKVNRD